MCRQSESIEKRRRAAAKLRDACCNGGRSLREILNDTVTEPLPPDFDDLLKRAH